MCSCILHCEVSSTLYGGMQSYVHTNDVSCACVVWCDAVCLVTLHVLIHSDSLWTRIMVQYEAKQSWKLATKNLTHHPCSKLLEWYLTKTWMLHLHHTRIHHCLLRSHHCCFQKQWGHEAKETRNKVFRPDFWDLETKTGEYLAS